nr:PREDICTED: bax inhibitor 1-like isoform X2 [Anolis carolinensis]|eukprot:XP_008110724.1 PREDICTED: bax inhibitor 1-like isoform X2 [Anolis carolinensis]
MRSDNNVWVLSPKMKTIGVTGKYLSKMEGSLPICILYIKYQHPGGDSPEVTSSVKIFEEDDLSPTSNQQHTGEKPQEEHKEFPTRVRTVRSSPSHGRQARRTRSAHLRRRKMATFSNEEGPFSDKTARRVFLRKIYLMLTIHLSVTVGIICMFIYWKYLTIWVRRRPWFSYTLVPALLILAIALACCDHARRKFPLNIILLLIFTMLEGTLLGSIAVFFDAESVMWTVAATTVIMFGFSIFLLQSKWDLTITSGILFILCFVVVIFGLLAAILQSMWLRIVSGAFGTVLFSVYLLVDTQLMLGKTHHYRLEPNDYIFAVLNVYIDIINTCLFVLKFVGFLK